MRVYRATEPAGQEWRVEITATKHSFHATVFVAYDRSIAGSGIRLGGVDALGKWLDDHGMTEADLQPW